MKRPPSRTGATKPKKARRAPSILLPMRPTKAAAEKPVKPSRQVIRKESKRLSLSEKNSRNNVARIRPKVDFGKRIILAVVSSVSVLVVLVLIAVFSPLLAVHDIEVVGANRVSSAAILRDLKTLKGKPLPQITSDEIAAMLNKYQLIDSVSAVALPPSKLRVVVVERSAVVIVRINEIAYLYDAAGVQLGRAKPSDKLPEVINAGNPSTSKSFSSAIKVVLSLPMDLLPKVSAISASSLDNVVLDLRAFNQRILWGDDSDPALKAKVLAALMNHYAKRYGQTFDVSSPSQPSVY